MIIRSIPGFPVGHQGLKLIPGIQHPIHIFIRGVDLNRREIILIPGYHFGFLSLIRFKAFELFKQGFGIFLPAFNRDNSQHDQKFHRFTGSQGYIMLQGCAGIAGIDKGIGQLSFFNIDGILFRPVFTKEIQKFTIKGFHFLSGGKEKHPVPGFIGLFDSHPALSRPIPFSGINGIIGLIKSQMIEMLVIGLADQINQGMAQA